VTEPPCHPAPDGDAPGPLPTEPFVEAERLLSSSPAAASELLERLARSDDVDARVQALAMLSIQEAISRSEEGLRRARARLREAEALGGGSPLAQARLSHARGYLAYREADDRPALLELNRAATLYASYPRMQARVFDTLGMLLSRRGDLDGAYDYFMLAIRLKQAEAGADPGAAAGADPQALAITYGNLGRLELSRERYFEAERWLRKDLELLMSNEHRPATEAHVRNQLALAVLGQGPQRRPAAREELERALELAPPDSVSLVYVLKDLASLSLDEGDLPAAHARLGRARSISSRHRFPEVDPWLCFLEARIWLAEDDDERATAAFEQAWVGFSERNAPQEACDVAIAWASALGDRGRPHAAQGVLEAAQRVAEVHLFRQENPLARIEALLEDAGADGPTSVMRARVRRMLGGVSEHWLLERRSTEYHARRLRGERAWVTVWTCDIRGFTEFCNQTSEPQRVVKMLNRFFARVGQAILEQGGCIDKYVGDSVLAYFHGESSPRRAALASLDAADRVLELNAERVHLGEPPLQIGVGLASGFVVEGNVGFAGKLEHTIIGTPVNTACRLVAKANAEQVLLDDATRLEIEPEFDTRPVDGGTLELKGLGRVGAHELLGRRRRPATPPPSG
jgi:class 3 adenylate cyclase